LTVALIAAVAIGAYLLFGGQGGSSTTTVFRAGVGEIRIPVSDVSSGEARFFTYTASNNTPVRFFVIKSGDGVYRAALDACDVCYHAKQGYRQEGQEMVCQKCGLRFHSTLINEVSGGCNPVGVPRTVQGDQLVINEAELEKRTAFF
jgi:uncharacterized membrane protein